MRLSLAVFATTLVGAAIACVDLFHSTDFQTLCAVDAEACTAASGADAADVTTDAKKPLVDFCKYGLAEARDHAARACAWLGACLGGLGDTAFGPCMVRALAAYDCESSPGLRPRGQSEEMWSCLSTVASCADVDACIFPERVPECAGVDGGSFTACSGTAVRLECGRPERGRATGVEPCALFGKSCAKIDESRAACVGVASVGCSVAAPHCEGSGAVQCDVDDPPRDRGVDCAATGAGTCTQETGFIACNPGADAAACSPSAPLGCDDAGRATACASGKSIVVDCTRLGLRCDPSRSLRAYDPVVACGAPDGGCTTVDQCSGDTLRSCANGNAFEVTCSAVGLKPCAKGANRLLPSCTP